MSIAAVFPAVLSHAERGGVTGPLPFRGEGWEGGMRDRRLTDFARSMRQEASEPEQRLWLALRARRFGNVKFRRQKVVGPYIVDFACREPMLVVEIDGETHVGRERHDAGRTRYLEAQGYRVMRFMNVDVMANLEGVLQAIACAIAPLPTLPPEGERAL